MMFTLEQADWTWVVVGAGSTAGALGTTGICYSITELYQSTNPHQQRWKEAQSSLCRTVLGLAPLPYAAQIKATGNHARCIMWT